MLILYCLFNHVAVLLNSIFHRYSYSKMFLTFERHGSIISLVVSLHDFENLNYCRRTQGRRRSHAPLPPLPSCQGARTMFFISPNLYTSDIFNHLINNHYPQLIFENIHRKQSIESTNISERLWKQMSISDWFNENRAFTFHYRLK